MSSIRVMKFPMYYTKKSIKKINRVRPDILIFDDDFITSLENFNLPDSIIYLDFGNRFNKSLKYTVLPKYLKKIKFGDNFSQPLDYIKLPETLEVIEFGKNYNTSLFCVKFPDSLREIILKSYFNAGLPTVLPSNIEKIVFGSEFDYSVNTFLLPEKIKYLCISGDKTNKVLIDKLPSGIKTLKIIDRLDFEMQNLPLSLEELILDIKSKDTGKYRLANLQGLGHLDLNSNEFQIVNQTNLPIGLKKIQISNVSLAKYIIKIPFDCVLVDNENQPIINKDTDFI
jgi:hypothetical protein